MSAGLGRVRREHQRGGESDAEQQPGGGLGTAGDEWRDGGRAGGEEGDIAGGVETRNIPEVGRVDGERAGARDAGPIEDVEKCGRPG